METVRKEEDECRRTQRRGHRQSEFHSSGRLMVGSARVGVGWLAGWLGGGLVGRQAVWEGWLVGLTERAD